jgi:hypothetical protein
MEILIFQDISTILLVTSIYLHIIQKRKRKDLLVQKR